MESMTLGVTRSYCSRLCVDSKSSPTPARFEVKPMRSDIHTCDRSCLLVWPGQVAVWLTKHASAPRGFGSSTRLCPLARCGTLRRSQADLFPL